MFQKSEAVLPSERNMSIIRWARDVPAWVSILKKIPMYVMTTVFFPVRLDVLPSHQPNLHARVSKPKSFPLLLLFLSLAYIKKIFFYLKLSLISFITTKFL